MFGLFLLMIMSSALGQTPAPSTTKPAGPGFRELSDEDKKRAMQTDEQIDNALNADHWDEAIARAEELLALRSRAQGPKYFETVDAEWNLKTLRRVSAMSKEDRVAYKSVISMNKRARTLRAQAKYAAAQPLYEKALEISRRLLTDDHPHTASYYNGLAANLYDQGKYAAAQPLFEKALEINRRLFTDDHPNVASAYYNLAMNLHSQGKHAEARRMNENRLEIERRLFTDVPAVTANRYASMAANLALQGKYAEAQPLYAPGS